jgi:hypothetical protein
MAQGAEAAALASPMLGPSNCRKAERLRGAFSFFLSFTSSGDFPFPFVLSFKLIEMDTYTLDVWPTFQDWWNLYDYKLDRKRCERLWSRMSQSEKEQAMEHTQRYTPTTHTDGTFPSRRHPGTYLQNGNWNDDALIRVAANTQLASAAAKADEYFARRSAVANGNAQ